MKFNFKFQLSFLGSCNDNLRKLPNEYRDVSVMLAEFLREILRSFSQYFNTDRSKAVLLLWFLTVTCSCCPYLYFGSANRLAVKI